MGQKINPQILRLGTIYAWESRWFNNKNYKEILLEDYKLRTALMEKLKYAGIARVEIERSINNAKIILYVSKPGMVIGRAGTGLEDVKKFISSILEKNGINMKVKTAPKIEIRVEAIKEPNLDPYLVAKNIAEQLAKRLPFKRVLNQNAERVMLAGAKGVKILLSGRIAGSEISRREKIHIGTVPFSTIREHVVYANHPSLTKKGYIGVKVWINQGEKGGDIKI